MKTRTWGSTVRATLNGDIATASEANAEGGFVDNDGNDGKKPTHFESLGILGEVPIWADEEREDDR